VVLLLLLLLLLLLVVVVVLRCVWVCVCVCMCVVNLCVFVSGVFFASDRTMVLCWICICQIIQSVEQYGKLEIQEKVAIPEVAKWCRK
jgi:hypothetical protein